MRKKCVFLCTDTFKLFNKFRRICVLDVQTHHYKKITLQFDLVP